MIAAGLFLAALTEFGMDAYPTIGIVKTEEVEVIDSRANVECEEGETWRIALRENLQVEVTPEESRPSLQRCAGHDMEAAREDKGLVWFHNKSTAEELAASIRKELQENRDVDSNASLVRLASKNGLYGVAVHLVHRDDAFSCSNCHFQSAQPPRQEGWEEKRIYRCPGHWQQVGGHQIYSEGDSSEKRRQKARAKLLEMRRDYQANPSYMVSEFYLHQHPHEDAMDFDIHGWVRHKDGVKKQCGAAPLVLSYVLPQRTSERWVADKSFDPACPCIKEIYGQPETRDCGGVLVRRDSWSRVRVFECAKEKGSRCEECRREGGRLLKKECIRTGIDGRCMRWKKLYEMKKFSPFTKRIHQFEEGRESYGFKGEFDHLKQGSNKSDFAEVFGAILGAASAYSSEKEVEAGLLYRGQAIETREDLPDERCHFVGLKMDGSEDVRFVYCCFASKIARIIQEGAKSFWGSAENPDCNALSKVDIESLDLSEMHDSFIDADMVERIRKQMAGR